MDIIKIKEIYRNLKLNGKIYKKSYFVEMQYQHKLNLAKRKGIQNELKLKINMNQGKQIILIASY